MFVNTCVEGNSLFTKLLIYIKVCVPFQGSNMTIAHGRQYKRENQENMVAIRLTEDEWYHTENRQPVSRQEFMTILYNLEQLLIKATYHTAQDTV